MVKVQSTTFSSWTFCNLLLFGETQPCEQTQVQNATTKRYHKTLPLMGATRPASGIKAKVHTLNTKAQH